ncbi:MAG: hypothetical protein JJU20_06520 [Opitutales bacterium]|nr:hypothetical protein [Opitutales bacterium]
MQADFSKESDSRQPERLALRLPLFTACFIVVLLLCACQSAERAVSETVWGYGVEPGNFYAVNSIDAAHRNLAVLPVSGVADPKVAALLQEAFRDRLLLTNRFRVLPAGEAALADADVFLRIEVTSYSAYPPLNIGARLYIATMDGGDVLWSIDQFLNAGDPAVARSARRYGQSQHRRDYPVQSGEAILLSPRQFARFFADFVFSTLPPLSYTPERS